jgi:hypothetical protein
VRQTNAGIYLPSDGIDVPADYLDATEEYDEGAAIDQCIDFRRWLKGLDARFDLVYVKIGARSWPKDNRWYIVRRSDSGLPANIWVVEDEQGDYCEPDERHARRLQEMDTAAHPRLWSEIQKRKEQRKIRSALRHEATREEFRTKLGERLDHIFDGRISVDERMKSLLSGALKGKKPPPPPRKQRRKKDRH